MAGLHVEPFRLNWICITANHNASRTTAPMYSSEIVMANAFALKSHVMVSV